MAVGPATLRLPHHSACKPFYFSGSSYCSRRSVAIIVYFDPSAAEITASLRWHINHVRVFLDRFIGGELAGQFEVQLCRLVGESLGIVDRCFD